MSELQKITELPSSGYIRQSQLLAILPFSAATLWRSVKSKKFPQPIKLSERVTAWPVAEVKAWIEEKSKANNSKK